MFYKKLDLIAGRHHIAPTRGLRTVEAETAAGS